MGGLSFRKPRRGSFSNKTASHTSPDDDDDDDDWEVDAAAMRSDDVSSIHVGESVSSPAPVQSNSRRPTSTSMAELSMLLPAVSEEASQQAGFVTNTSQSSKRSRDKQTECSKNNTTDTNKTKSSSSRCLTTLVALSLMMEIPKEEPNATTTDDSVTASQVTVTAKNNSVQNNVPERIVQETLRHHANRVFPTSSSLKTPKITLPIDADDGSFVIDESSSLSNVVSAALQQHVEQRDFDNAIEIYHTLLKAQRKQANTEQEIALTLSALSALYLYKGDTKRSLHYSKKALRLQREQQQSSQTKNVPCALLELGVVYFCRNKLDQALSAWRESLQIACKVLGYGHVHVPLILNNIGCLHYESGELVAALATFEEALDLQRHYASSQEENDADTALLQMATTLCNMGMVSLKRKQYDSAVALFEEGLLVQESVLGNKHDEVSKITSDHLNMLMELKAGTTQPELTERLHIVTVLSSNSGSLGNSNKQDVSTTCSSPFGDSDGIPMMHSSTSVDDNSDCIHLGSLTDELTPTLRVRETVLASFGIVQSSSSPRGDGDDSEVRRLHNTAADGAKTAAFAGERKRMSIPVDVDGDNVLDAELHLEDIYAQAAEHLEHDEIDEALELFQSALRSHKEKYGEVHHLVGTAWHNMGLVYLYAEKYNHALPLFQEAVNVRMAALGPDHPEVSASLLKTGMIQMANEDLDSAHVTFCQVLHSRRKVLGYKHPQVAKILNNIGCVHYEFGGLCAALKALEEALEIQRRCCQQFEAAPSRSEAAALAVASTLGNIGFIRAKRTEYSEAIVALQEALQIQRDVLYPDHPAIQVTMENLAHVMAASNIVANPGQNKIIKMTEMYTEMLRCGAESGAQNEV